MGQASIARCDSGVASSLSTCGQRACSSCGNNEGTGVHGRSKLCNWQEDEVTTQAGDSMIGLDYGFLGGWAPSSASTGCPPAPRPLLRPLFEPGSLVALRGGDAALDNGDGGATAASSIASVYTLDAEPLGRGSYGEVTGATHNATGARRAVKSVGKAGLKRYVSNVTGFVRREVDILRRLDHPNVVRLYEAFEDESMIYLVLEVCEGGDLLERVAVTRERLPEREAAVLLAQMLGAVQHLYLRGVVHRDIKPENFLFTRREPGREPLPPEAAPVKLIDFGLSRRLSFEAGMRMTPKIGTTEYMAPEAFAGRVSAALADRADMWSIGVVLHVIFIGHFPSPRLQEQTTEEYLTHPCWSRLSPHGKNLLAQLLRYEPAQRPTVTVALKHPWLAIASRTSADTMLVHTMPGAVRSYASSIGLRRLALAAAAREVDDQDLGQVRALFQSLELECDGALTRPALERAAWLQGAAGMTAAELSRAFDFIDIDGSGTIDWTELVAVALGACTLKAAGSDDGATSTNWLKSVASDEGVDGGRATTTASGLPTLRQDACWRAFDLLSQGNGAVSGVALGQLFAPQEVGAWLACGGRSGGGTGGSTDGSIDPSSVDTQAPRVAEYDRLVREVDASGTIVSVGFMKMLATSV